MSETNSTTRLAMMRAVRFLPSSTLVAPIEVIAEILERESGYRELYEALDKLSDITVCAEDRFSAKWLDDLSNATADALAALAKARGETASNPVPRTPDQQ